VTEAGFVVRQMAPGIDLAALQQRTDAELRLPG